MSSYDLSNVVKAACEMSAAMGISIEETLRLFSVVVTGSKVQDQVQESLGVVLPDGTAQAIADIKNNESNILFDGQHFKARDVKVTLVKRGPQTERLPEPGERYIELEG